MKNLLLISHSFIKWLVLLFIFLAVFLYFVLESPSTVLGLLKSPLKEQGITYGKMEGGLLSGFTLTDVHYNNQVYAKEVSLKVDFEQLKNRVLYIDNLVLKNASIDKDFLSSLIDSNATEENKTEGNSTLPFDRVVVNRADISLKDIAYQEYDVHAFKLHVNNLETDMKREHEGDVTLWLDSNMAKADVNATFKNEEYHLAGVIEGEKSFIAAFVVEQNLSFLSNPKLTLKADGDLEKIDYDVTLHRLDFKQNEYEVHSKTLHTFGNYSIVKKDVVNSTKAAIVTNMGDLKLDSHATLNLDDLNNTLVFDLDSTFKPKNSSIVANLREQNITIQAFPTVKIFAKGNMKNVNYKTTIKGLKAKQNGMALNLKDLDLKGTAKPLDGDVTATLLTHFDSSLAGGVVDAKTSLNYKDLNNTLTFSLKTDLKSHGNGLSRMLKDSNVTVDGDAHIKIDAKGDMKNVSYSVWEKGLRGKQNNIVFNIKDLDLKGTAKPLDGDVKAILLTHFDSSLVGGMVDAKTSLNYKDINNTLSFTLNTDLNSHKNGLSRMLKDSNVTISSDSHVNLKAQGDMKNVTFSTSLKNLKGKQNSIAFNVRNVDIKGEAKPLNGDVDVAFMTLFGSTVADGKISGGVSLNSNDINNTFLLKNVVAKVDAHDTYINTFLKEQEFKLKGDTHLVLKAKGGLKDLQLDLNADTKVLKDKKISNVSIKGSPIELNLLSHQASGSVDIKSLGGSLGLNLKSSFSGDYTNPKSMKLKNKLEVDNLDAFGVNLKSLKPVKIDMKNEQGKLLVTVDSPKLQLKAESSDNDHFTFKLKSEGIYPAKIVELPRELKDTFVKADIEGEVTLSKNYFRVKGLIEANKGFKAHIDAKNDESGLDAKLTTAHLKLLAKGDMAKKQIEATLDIDSVTKLEKEFSALYPFTVTPVNGPLHAKVKMNGEEIFAKLNSPKLKMEGFNIESLDVDAHYAKELLTLNTLSFKTTGFKDKKLNRDFYLNQKGKIYLGEKRDVLIDMHPNILVKGKGTVENMSVDASIEKLPLGHPNYGNMILSTHINYSQIGKKRKIVGGISLDKLKVFYEAKFLDAAHDPDVIVITKKDKKKKKESDNFLEDTYIDLAIYAPDAQYKTRDIELKFTVDVKAKKAFGKNLGMLGKIRDINGRVEQAPKLFTVVDSNIVFRGLKDINPLLDIKVEHELPDVLITINIHGDANRPKLDFSSDPAMAKKDILSYLLLGVSTASLSEGGGSLGREAQLFIMNQAARDFAYEVELDRVFIKDDGTGEGYAVQVGKKIDDDTMFIIENSKEGNSFILEYEVNKNIKVEVGQHQKTVPSQSIDVFFRKRFR